MTTLITALINSGEKFSECYIFKDVHFLSTKTKHKVFQE